MFCKIQRNKFIKVIAVFLAILIAVNIFDIPVAQALTSGPSQPEFSGFSQVGTAEMVDPFTGDFSYNIPLFEIGGFPVNLTYNSNITMDQEASWVGLGWSLNTGAIVRNLRGLPDDFSGDIVTEIYKTKDIIDIGTNFAVSPELFQLQNENLSKALSAELGLGMVYNNYTGLSSQLSLNFKILPADKAKGPLNGSLGINSGCKGMTVDPSISLTSFKNSTFSLQGGMSLNSRLGLTSYSLGYDGKKGNNEFNGGHSFSFAMPTFVPSGGFPYRNYATNCKFKVSSTTRFLSPYFAISGFYSQRFLTHYTYDRKSYGYLNVQNASTGDVLLDFNREKEGEISQYTSIFPLTNFTYDIFDINALGLGGTFRAFRNDIGQVYDVETISDDGSLGAGFEVAGGDYSQLGLDVTGIMTQTTSGGTESTSLAGIKFKSNFNASKLYEPYCFRMVDEINSGTDPNEYYSGLGAKDPVQFKVNDMGKWYNTQKAKIISIGEQLIGNNFSWNNAPNTEVRQKRNTNIQVLTVEQAEKLYGNCPYFHRNSGAQSHHIGMIIITKPDGTKYIFGETIYNITQKEVTFSIDTRSPLNSLDNKFSEKEGWVKYSTESGENGITNKSGLEHLYSSKTLTPYAHTFLLTAILSSDYVDVNSDGIPGRDDYGNYVLFNYISKGEYNWRTPYYDNANMANYEEHMRHKSNDDKGSYVFGTRETKYLQSIVTKTQMATFVLSKREDSYGVLDENGGKDLKNPLYKLSSIIYSSVGLNGIPFTEKTIYFDYDYSLCHGIPNSSGNPDEDWKIEMFKCGFTANVNRPKGGKLTLKNIFIFDRESNKGCSQPYVFNYSDVNPSYSYMAYDRWGSFKVNPNQEPFNTSFPYTSQIKTTCDENARAWKLSEIDLPTGGVIKVNYESDDYAYVQDKPAMEMCKILGTITKYENNEFSGLVSQLYNSKPSDENNYLIVQLNKPCSGFNSPGEADAFLQKEILAKPGESPNNLANNMYFKVMTNVNDPDKDGYPIYEYVNGYCEIELENCFFYNPSNESNYDKIAIKLKQVQIGDKGDEKYNPISKTAWQFIRSFVPEYAFEQPEGGDFNLMDFINSLKTTVITNSIDMVTNPDKRLGKNGFGKFIKPECSWVRLYTWNGCKYGGGSRVKNITIYDNWNDLASGKPAAYRTEYNYKLDNGYSSGVASYEPIAGGEENSCKIPAYNTNDRKWYEIKTTDKIYQEEPAGESFFPAPVVGYSRVVTRQVPLEYSNGNYTEVSDIGSHGTGKTIYEFYTAKDFPVETYRTNVDYLQKKPLVFALYYQRYDFFAAATQGFSIVLNDMHGKPKSVTVYSGEQVDNKDKLISKIEYFYKVDQNTGKLSNSVDVVNKQGIVSEKDVGREIDFITDYRQNLTKMNEVRLQGNLGATSPYLFLILGFGTLTQETTSFESCTTTKVIHNKGILEKVVASDLGSSVETLNLLYDQETGQPVLNRTINEYNDVYYTFNYPGFWAYKNLEQSYLFSGLTFDQSDLTTMLPNLSEGDQFLVTEGTSNPVSETYIYCNPENITGGLGFYDLNGVAKPCSTFLSSAKFELISTGRTNKSMETIGTIVCKNNPIIYTNNIPTSIQFSNNTGIINANSTEYKSQWRNRFWSDCYVSGSAYRYSLSKDYSTQNTFNEIKDLIEKKGTKKDFSSYSLNYSALKSFFICNCQKFYSNPLTIVDELNEFLTGLHNDPDYSYSFGYNFIIKKSATASNCIEIIDNSSGATTYLSFFTNCEMTTPLNLSSIDELEKYFSISACNSPGCETIKWVKITNNTYPVYHLFYNPPNSSNQCYVLFKGANLNYWTSNSISTKNPLITIENTNITSPCSTFNMNVLYWNYANRSNDQKQMVFTLLYGAQIDPENIESINFDFTSIYSASGHRYYAEVIHDGSQVSIVGIDIGTPCIYTQTYKKVIEVPPSIPPQMAVNNWYPTTQYFFNTLRTFTETAANSEAFPSNIRVDGKYISFTPFWDFAASPTSYMSIPSSIAGWQWVNAVSEISPFGYDLENVSPIGTYGVYTSVIYGYDHRFPVAVAKNASLAQIANDNMEDYQPFWVDCPTEQFKFFNNFNLISSDKAHTGKYSINIPNGQNISFSRALNEQTEIDNTCFNDKYSNSKGNVKTIKLFSPYKNKSGQQFLLTFWVATSDINENQTTFYNNNTNLLYIEVSYGDTPITGGIYKYGPIIEGWRKIDYLFTFPSTDQPFQLTITNSTGKTVYIDDLRILPPSSTMKSFVYNPSTNDLMAELDENNYATLYEYDASGNVVRIKKETERGIMTIKESRVHYYNR